MTHSNWSPRSFARGAIALAAGLSAVLTLSACSGAESGSADTADGGSLAVVTTTTQLADFAASVGGDDIALTGLLTPGNSAHHFDPSPADLLALSRADVLVVNGLGLESFIDGAVEASGFSGEIIVAADGLDEEVLEAISGEHGGEHVEHDHAEHDHDHADHDHADHDHAEHDHDHADHDHAGHDHGSINPHVWTSPGNAKRMVETIAAGFVAADPAHAAAYTDRADAYLAQLDELDDWAAAQFERVPAEDRQLVSGHDSLRYFLHDYDIEFVGAILPSFEDNAEPSAADIDALVAAITEGGVKAVFVESSMSPKLAQTIAREAGVEVVDADTLYADSLGAVGSAGETYIAATVHNTQVMLSAWGVDPEPFSLDTAQ